MVTQANSQNQVSAVRSDASGSYCVTKLQRGQARALPRGSRSINVASGSAWITQDGDDFLLNAGDGMRFMPGSGIVVVSAVGEAPLIYETN
jgi:hypothetical protein